MRFDPRAGDGYRSGDAECWIAVNDYSPDLQGMTTFLQGTGAEYTGLWMTLKGQLYVTRRDGWVLRHGDIHADPRNGWETDHLEGQSLRGVFGVDGGPVWVWGQADGTDRCGSPVRIRWSQPRPPARYSKAGGAGSPRSARCW